MAFRALWTCLSFLILLGLVGAQIGPDPRWLNPDGSQSDFSSSFTAGKTITLQWKTLNASDTKSDLWLTHWNATKFEWHTKVASGVDISQPGSLSWNVDVPASTINDNDQFVLRFFPANSAYGILQFRQFASPGFRVTGGTNSDSTNAGGAAGATTTQSDNQATSTQATTKGDATSTSASQSSTTSVVTTTDAAGSVITATITTSVSSATSTPSSSSGLPIGAQVGIGVGAGVFIIILFVTGCFFGRRFGIGKTLRHHEGGPEKDVYVFGGGQGAKFDKGIPAAEVAGTVPMRGYGGMTGEGSSLLTKGSTYSGTTEWHNSRTPWSEANGDNMHAIEKSGAMIRPGVHEVP